MRSSNPEELGEPTEPTRLASARIESPRLGSLFVAAAERVAEGIDRFAFHVGHSTAQASQPTQQGSSGVDLTVIQALDLTAQPLDDLVAIRDRKELAGHVSQEPAERMVRARIAIR